MSRINNIKLKSLEKTKNYLVWELKRGDSLTENEKFKYRVALRSIKKIIKEKENSEKKQSFNQAILTGFNRSL